MAAISACHRSPNPKSNKLCCFIILAGICPNSLRLEFIPINFKALVWPTGAVPEKTFRSKSVTYENPTLKTESRGVARWRQTPLRFHSPLIKPDVRIFRIRLSDKGPLCLRPRQVNSQSFQSQEPEPLVEMLRGKRLASRSLDLMLSAQPSTEPIPRVTIHRTVGFTHRTKTEVVGPSSQFRVDSSHQLSGFLTHGSPARQLADFLAEPLHTFLCHSGANISASRLARMTSPKCIPKELKRFLGHPAHP